MSTTRSSGVPAPLPIPDGLIPLKTLLNYRHAYGIWDVAKSKVQQCIADGTIPDSQTTQFNTHLYCTASGDHPECGEHELALAKFMEPTHPDIAVSWLIRAILHGNADAMELLSQKENLKNNIRIQLEKHAAYVRSGGEALV